MPVGYPTFGAPIGAQPYDKRVRVTGAPGPGAVVPYTSQFKGSFVRVGAGAPSLAKPSTPAAPAFPPTGTFDPQRELSVGEGQRGLEQLEAEGSTDRSRWLTDYGTSMDEYNREHKEQDDTLTKNLGLLGDSFKKLGDQQTERANAAGVLSGGALLQAAATRGSNEGKERGKQQESHDHNVAAIERQRSQYALDWAPPDASNPLGGRKWQDLAAHLRNAQSNQVFYRQGEEQLAGQESAERGGGVAPYTAQYGGSFVRVGGKPAARAPTFWNSRTHRMETYRNGRWGG